ncbi:hypothetical protein [Zavarzinella formosa]|uniref:hypothetical protein n=1 Tax=Zavarzinella formosa TaxID=360055 RepID=UPI0002D59231|nr:hypothetical protein [Zavarzinella formosa]
MGYVIFYDPQTMKPREILGDEYGQQQAQKALGLPHKADGRNVSEGQLAAADKTGE